MRSRPMPMSMFLQFALFFAPSAARAQTALVYLDYGPGSAGCCVAGDAAGNIYVAASSNYVSAPGLSSAALFVTKLDPALKQVYQYRLDVNEGIYPAGIVVDAQGNAFVAGETGATNLPAIHPIAGAASSLHSGFAIKLNSAGDQLLFSSYYASQIYALALDPAGNLYLAGYTSLPCAATAGAYQPPSFAAQNYCGIVAKLSNSGSLVYAALLANAPSGVAVSPDGSATVAGQTSYPGYPVTSGAFQAICGCQSHAAVNGFVSRLSPDGGSLEWSTFLGGTGTDGLSSIALAQDGSVVVAGPSSSPDFPITPGALQAATPDGAAAIAVAKLNSTGSRLIFSSRFGNSFEGGPVSVQLDSQGHSWINGQAPLPGFPTLPGSLIPGSRQFIAEMAPDASRLLLTQFPPNYSADAVVLDPAGYEILTGENGSLMRFPVGGPLGAAILGEGNAVPGPEVGYTVSGIVSPGGIVTLYGAGLGPAVGVGAQLDSSGKIATSVGGTQALFGGVPAPLLYVSANQINAVVPFGVGAGPFTTVEVQSLAGASAAVTLGVVAADPAILAIPDPAAGGYESLVVNQDGSINSLSNPADPGSIVTFWATGTGLFQTTLEDGAIVQPPLPAPALAISVVLTEGSYSSGVACKVLYAGAAPGMVAGILQVNAQIPAGVSPGAAGGPYNGLEIRAGSSYYYGTVAVK